MNRIFHMHFPKKCPVAASMGFATAKIVSLDDIDSAMQLVENRTSGVPVLIEASIDADVVSTIYQQLG